MPRISDTQCYYRCLEMFHAEGGPSPKQLNATDKIEGPVLGYTAQQHRALSGRINNKYYADVNAKTTPTGVLSKDTIGALSDYIFSTIPAGNQLKEL